MHHSLPFWIINAGSWINSSILKMKQQVKLLINNTYMRGRNKQGRGNSLAEVNRSSTNPQHNDWGFAIHVHTGSAFISGHVWKLYVVFQSYRCSNNAPCAAQQKLVTSLLRKSPSFLLSMLTAFKKKKKQLLCCCSFNMMRRRFTLKWCIWGNKETNLPFSSSVSATGR